MHCHRRLRSREIVRNVQELLEDMAVDARIFRGVGYEARNIAPFESTASSPSLRSPEPLLVQAPPPTPPAQYEMGNDMDTGNVKVVVRVRKFLKRGMFTLSNDATSARY